MASLADFGQCQPTERSNSPSNQQSKIFRAVDSKKCRHRRESRFVSRRFKSAHRHWPYFGPSISGIDNANASPWYGVTADRLLDLVGGEPHNIQSYCSGDIETGRSPSQPFSDTSENMDLGFDLYNASCSDAAIHLADHCVSIITGLGSALQIYLLDQFWIHFNSCIPVVHKSIFLTSLEEAYGDFCSPELHLAVLAMGLRRADHKRSDVLQLFLPDWDSILHKKLRLVIDNLSTRKERQSITYAQAVIILAQLEWERGRDHTARLHLSNAVTMIAEIRNHRHELDMAVSDDEIIAQRIALRAVSLIDSHTVLFNHNFNTILDDRSRISNFATIHRLRVNPQSSTQTQDLSSQIFNAHLELMSISTNGIEQLQSQQTCSTDNPFSRLTALHNRLQSWYRSLPNYLSLNYQTKQSSPPSLFILHQQFHAILILLYRPYSLQKSLASIMDRFKDVNIDQISEEIHNILLTNAMQIADLILESRKRFELGAIFPMSVQQGALAAGVLLTMSRVAGNRIKDSSLRYLQYLQQFFSEMSAINGPAERLDRTLQDLTATTSSFGRPTQRRTQSVEITNSGRPGTETSIGGPNDTPCLHRSDDNGQGSLPGCAADQQGTTAAYAYRKDNGAPRSGIPDDLDPTRDLDHRTVPPPPATNTSINIRSLSQSSDRCINAMDSESMPSSHAIDRGLNHLTPVDIPLEEGGLFAPQLPLGIGNLSLPGAGPDSDSWNQDDVSVSWLKTFKTLKEVNERPVSQKMVANEFGDVMGCIFKLW